LTKNYQKKNKFKLKMKILKDFISRYGLGAVLAGATLVGYRRQVINDRNNKILDKINEARNNLTEAG
jgi:hypothetical protein